MREDLGTHLSTLQRQGVIHSWHDRRISAGSEWAGAIDENLNSADIILLLIKANFLASDYCNDKELKRALERHQRGEARVIPIILKPSDWATTSLGGLQALPTDGKAVTSWSNRDQAFLAITQGIRQAALEMEEGRGKQGPPVMQTPAEPAPRSTGGSGSGSRSRLFISYKRGAEPDEALAQEIHRTLSATHQVFSACMTIEETAQATATACGSPAHRS